MKLAKLPRKILYRKALLPGVPFLIKDLISVYAGVKLTVVAGRTRIISPITTAKYKTLQERRAVALGKTNTPEFGLMGITEPELFGPTRKSVEYLNELVADQAGLGCGRGIRHGAHGFRRRRRWIHSHSGKLLRADRLKPSRGRIPTGPKLGALWQGAAVEKRVNEVGA